jgi:hypothetical protein
MKKQTIYVDVDGTLLDHSHDQQFIASGYDLSWYNQQYVSDLAINIGLVAELILLKKYNKLVLWTNRGEEQKEMTIENLGNIWNMFDEHQFHSGKKYGTNVDGYTFDNEAKYVNNGTVVPNYKGDTTMNTIAIIAAIRQHIITECILASGGQLFPCVKQSVYACVITADGRAYYGANWMTSSDVTICPRILANTTSYELCATVCGQGTEFHAERQAMWSAMYDDANLVGAEMFIVGHTYCCDTCRAAMFAEGITYAASLDSGKHYERGVDTMKEMLPAPPAEIILGVHNIWPSLIEDEVIKMRVLRPIIWDNCMGSYVRMANEGDVINVIRSIYDDGSIDYAADFNGIIDGVELDVEVELIKEEDDFIDFGDDHGYASFMQWVAVAIHGECFVDRWGRIMNGRYVHRYAENETNHSYQEFGDLVESSETYYNMYDELCVRKTDKLIPYGIYDAETERAFYYGAFTEISLAPYKHPLANVIDMEWDL